MKVSLDRYLESYSTKQPHQGCGVNGRTLLKAFLSLKEKTKNTKPEAETMMAT